MAPRELTRAQLSSRLSYSQQTPKFLLRLQSKYSGNRAYDDDHDDGDDEENKYRDDADFEDFDRGSGRPPIPRRPSIPERPPDDPGSADEDDDDEKPQVVVLKEGRHLTEHEAENIRRKAKGLPSLPDPTTAGPEIAEDVSVSKPKENSSGFKHKPKKPTLTFSTSSSNTKNSSAKRKLDVIGQIGDDEADGEDEPTRSNKESSQRTKSPPTNKKQKKNVKTKTLLSFGDDA
ncbi:hypothetical protein APHAL10511_007829 [Amanita phalloides]|nr:hypothetical protein APHAL10511_007829 [Amanita phalloides]